jgi:hypothetical protein
VTLLLLQRRGTARQARRPLAALAGIGLLAAFLTLGLGNLVFDTDGHEHRVAATQVAGDDLAPAVLPALVALVALLLALAIALPAARLPRFVRLAAPRGRAPPAPFDI